MSLLFLLLRLHRDKKRKKESLENSRNVSFLRKTLKNRIIQIRSRRLIWSIKFRSPLILLFSLLLYPLLLDLSLFCCCCCCCFGCCCCSCCKGYIETSKEEEQVFIASAKGRLGRKAPTPKYM